MKHKALFLDRDGIINIDHGYISSFEQFEFSEGIFDCLRLFVNSGYILFVITNQSGIGRGYYSQNDFLILTEWMLERLKREGITVKSVEYCPHTPKENCQCRKPSTGMIDRILSKYDIDLNNSWLMGDKQSDIDLAHNAEIGHTIAIGDVPIENAQYRFGDIMECKAFLEENQDTIL